MTRFRINTTHKTARRPRPFRADSTTKALVVSLAAMLLFPLLGCRTTHYEPGRMVVGDRTYPGVMVDVGGRDLFVNCTAPAPYTVVLEAGGGGVSLTWKPVQALLAREASIQVCSYDRLGLGWSDPYPGPYAIDEEVEMLHAALSKVGAGERRILVGGSYGGFLIQLYAAKYPDEVAGLVYADPNTVAFFDRHPEIVEEIERARIPWYVDAAPRWLVRRVGKKQLRPLLRLPDEADNNTLVRLSTTRKHMRTTVMMNRAFGATVAQMRAVENPAEVPTVVITRGRPFPHPPWTTPQRERAWRESHRTLLTGVRNGRHVVATESDHAVNFDQPDLIAEIVLEVVEAARTRPAPPAASSH